MPTWCSMAAQFASPCLKMDGFLLHLADKSHSFAHGNVFVDVKRAVTEHPKHKIHIRARELSAGRVPGTTSWGSDEEQREWRNSA
jgi:hypothetical protein